MARQVLDVGNCDPDHRTLTTMLKSNFDVQVTRVHGLADALSALENGSFDLVLVNRLMDRDGSPGIDIIRTIKRDCRFHELPVMMITNFSEHQQQAVEAGALPGFGKAQVHAAETRALLESVLG